MFRDREQVRDEWTDLSPGLEAGQSARAPRSEGPLPAKGERARRENARPPKPEAAVSKRPRRIRSTALAVAGLLALATGSYFGNYWWTTGRFLVSTDDAYVGASTARLAAKIPGYITNLAVDDNQYVRAGEVIAQIDEGDYRLAADAARGKVATQKATGERIEKQIKAQQAAVDQARA